MKGKVLAKQQKHKALLKAGDMLSVLKLVEKLLRQLPRNVDLLYI